MEKVLPSDVFRNNAPFGPDLLVNLEHFLELFLFPFGLVEPRVEEVYPLLSALNLRTVVTLLPECLCDLLPFLGGVERIDLCQ